ncbi:glyco_hydro_56 domain-containing protein isoform X2 [Betta splendens]|nr:glyco_hydro_56 domain-containing protein isoform X2 [Betta splendens]
MAWTEPWLHPDQRTAPRPSCRLRAFLSAVSGAQPAFVLPFLLLLAACMAGPPQPATPPLLSGQPFIIFWGVRDSSCSNRPDPRTFGMEREGRVSVFYEDTLGNYPYFINKDTPVNGGLPQHTKLNNHLQKTQQDLEAAVPAPRYLGLGVLRWAEWAPQWFRNRERQTMYLEASRKLLKTFFPNWTPEEVERWSQVDFEASAQSVIAETLREVQRLRPKALWGVSPYPSCHSGNYSGQCSAAEMALNDELLWLWRRCSALYPLLTLEKLQSGTPGSRLYLSSRIKEALRVSSLTATEADIPVFPLVKSVYTSTNTFLSQADLVSTIGESAAMGTAGVVIWERSETKTERECQDLAEFLGKVLGPYSNNVTMATRLCSASLCQGKGRCVRQNADSPAYLHLPPPSRATEKTEATKATNQQGTDSKTAEPDPAEMWKKNFQCQWYKSSDGDASDQQSPKDGASVGGTVDANSAEIVGTTTASTAASTTASTTSSTSAATSVSTTRGVSLTESRESSSASVGSPTPSLELASDAGRTLLAAPSLTLLLFLLAGNICLKL